VGFVVGRLEAHHHGELPGPAAGDLLVGIPSSGFHTNGYSLVRKVIFDVAGLDVSEWVEEIGSTIGDALLRPHRCYFRIVSHLMKRLDLHAIVHITGGGFQGNIPRALGGNLRAFVDTRSWTPPPLFEWVGRLGAMEREEMYRTFNMGIGMVLVISPRSLDVLAKEFGELRDEWYVIGELKEGKRGVELIT
jgi:phosphoribosylformylglycinamidine cyclo-ligase